MIRHSILPCAIATLAACTQTPGAPSADHLVLPASQQTEAPDDLSKVLDEDSQRPWRDHEIPLLEPWIVTAGGWKSLKRGYNADGCAS